MSRGHVTGHKKERPTAQDWYAVIAAETLRQLEAEGQALATKEETPDVS